MAVNNNHTVIDLFAGCGGLSLGLYQAGWHGVFAIEKNPCAFETLRYNIKKINDSVSSNAKWHFSPFSLEDRVRVEKLIQTIGINNCIIV